MKYPESSLRARAEEHAGQSLPEIPERPVEELLHELQVHQIELEMQNDELRRTQLTLEETRDRYIDLYEFAPVAYFSLNQQGIIVEANLRAGLLLGIERGKLLEKHFTGFVASNDVDRCYRLLGTALKQGERQTFDVALRRNDGNVLHAQVDCMPLPENSGPVLRIAMTDISERLRVETVKDEFLATLAHELRNPLAPVRNALHILQRPTVNAESSSWALQVIDRQIAQMTRLIDDLMDISRITFNKLELRKQRITLQDVLHTAIEISRPLMTSKQHYFKMNVPEESIALNADPARLAQVFSNLLNNAAKFSEPGSSIQLGVQVDLDEVVISIRDNGIGIAAALLPHIFEKFTQAKSTMQVQAGLGIGLTFAKRLVEMHGGSIEVHSEGLGKGSEFIVQLPLTAASGTAADDDPSPASAVGLVPDSKMKILVVDDNRDAAESVAKLLQAHSDQLNVAYDGLEALEIARTFHPDLVLLDIGLPKLNGYEVAQAIRRETWGKDVVLIALTGWGQEQDKRRVTAADFNHHLVKPVKPEALLQVIASFEQQKKMGT